MMTINRWRFYAQMRAAKGPLRQKQVDGIEAIFDACTEYEMDERFVAYILATAWHETGRTMEPVRETFAISDAQARARLHKSKYARVQDNGHAYYGRGFVQLTWRENYRKMGKSLNIDLEDNPDLALDPKIAARILVEGMMLGSFTGKRLADYFTDDKSDAAQARRIVNRLDRAEEIARHARNFLEYLRPPPMNTVLVL